MPGSPDVLIVGGGLAGCAAAIVLARAGRAVTLLEREAVSKHKVCGEFLSTEALHLLATLGIDPRLHGATVIRTVRFATRNRCTAAALPFAAQSLSRRCLDTLLLQAAEDAGVAVLRGNAVEHLAFTAGRWQATLSAGGRVEAPDAILAAGKHDLRGFSRPKGSQGDLIAFKMYFRLRKEQEAALEHAVELLLHPQGYTGLQLVEGGLANVTALVRRGRFAHLGSWTALLDEVQATNRHAGARLRGAEPLLAKPLALSAIPYGFIRRQAVAPTLYAVGDQAAVIPSFTGDGMAIALYSGVQAARSILAGEPATTFQPALCSKLRSQIGRATAISRAMLHPASKTVLARTVELWPAALRVAAFATRIAGQTAELNPTL